MTSTKENSKGFFRNDARCSLGTSDSSENWCTESLWNVVLKIRKFIDGGCIFRYGHSRFHQISDPVDQIFEGFFCLIRDFKKCQLLFTKNFLVEVNKRTQSFQMHPKSLETKHYAGFCVRKCIGVK